MATIKTAISLEEPLLIRIDDAARALEVPRSRLLALAAEEFLERHDNARLLAQLDRAYADEPTPEEQRLRQAHKNRRRSRGNGDW